MKINEINLQGKKWRGGFKGMREDEMDGPSRSGLWKCIVFSKLYIEVNLFIYICLFVYC